MTTRPRDKLLPTLLLLVLVAAPFLYWDKIAYQLGFDLLERTARVLRYLLGISVWMLLAFVSNQLIRLLLWEELLERQLQQPAPKLLRDMVTMVVFIAALAGIVGVVFERSLTLILAATGGAGVVVGFAIRDMIADLFSGIALSIERPFAIGDFLRLEDGGEGEVVSMSWRATHLRTTGNDIVIIPNSLLASQPVTNLHGAGSYFRTEFELWLDYSVPPERALRILNAAVKQVQHDIVEADEDYPHPITGEDLESDAIAVDISEIGIKYRVRFWLLEYTNWSTTRNTVICNVMGHLHRAGINPAYPQQDLYLARMPQRSTSSSDQQVALLSKIEIFQSLTAEELRQLAARLVQRHAGPGETIIRRGDQGDSLFIIAEGLVDVLIWVQAQGREMPVSQMVSGEFFGEMALLTGEERSATVVARTDTLLLEVTRTPLMELLQRRPEIAEQMTSVIGKHRLRDVESIDRLTPEEQAAEEESLVKQLLGKVKGLFGLG